ncbi:MAG: hypothetical protein GY832_31820 [Chloroflexi bacterium]|nr:hypothetical protein [Chloroflexota bacterium]
MKNKLVQIALAIIAILVLTLVTAVWAAEHKFEESFETAAPPALPSGWAQEIISGTKGTWATITATIHPADQPPHSGSNMVYFNAWSAGSGESVRLYRADSLDLSQVDDAQLSFWMYHDIASANDDQLQVQISTDGSIWHDVSASIPRYNGSTGWMSHTVSFKPYMGPGYDTVRVGLLGISEHGNDIHLDDVLFESTICRFDMCDSTGEINITEAGPGVVGEFSIGVGAFPTDTISLEPAIYPPSMLARQDYVNVYNEADGLLTGGINFRYDTLTIAPTAETITDALKNYSDFIGAAETFDKFCSDYDRVDAQGYCPEDDDIRNELVRARELFAFLSLAEPADIIIPFGGQGDVPVRQLGRDGVLAATREIANVHLIFGNEFLVDALDYRFSAGALPSANLIIQTEIDQLNAALQQFTLSVDVLAHAFNADFGGPSGIYIGDYFTEDEFDLFGIVSERMVMTMDEIANRYRQLGNDEMAMAIYGQGSTAQYVQALALANKALERDADFLNHGGWEMMTNLGRLRAMSRAVHDGLNPFGFRDAYVPLQSYEELADLTRNQLLRDASEDEAEARTAQRDFDHNATALDTELQNLRLTYNNQLLELCGETADDFYTCDSGLMKQNYWAMLMAHRRIELAAQRVAHIPSQIQIEQDRAGQVIEISIQQGEKLAAISYAIGVRNSYRETTSIVDSTTDEWHAGVEVSAGYQVGVKSGPFASVTASAGYSHSRSKTTSISKVWDPAAKEIGKLNGLRDVQQAATQAEITGANSNATIRNLLLQQADLMIEHDLAIDEFNRLSDEHNHLVEKYRNLLNLRIKAQENLIDSYLNNPAYRILRDTWTVEAARSHALAAQFAYLTDKALEYEYLTPIPFMDDIFMARSADDIDNFLNELEIWRFAISDPLGLYSYNISIAQDLLGLSDENLDPNSELTPSERAQLRYELFQEYLQQHTITDTVEFQFVTSLEDNNIFSSNIWNNRIAGVGLPPDVPGAEGVSINILTRQLGDAGTPLITLRHAGGYATYRTRGDEIVKYEPGNARLVGYQIPVDVEINGNARTAAIVCGVNGNQQGTPNSQLFNLSVATSDWTLTIDLTDAFNQDLDISYIEDIEIIMDTIGYALPGRRMAAQMDALKLRAELDNVPLQQLVGEEFDALQLEEGR